MVVVIGVVLCCISAVIGAVIVARRRPRSFPPVVELAQTGRLPRWGFKIASLTARDTASPALAPTTAPATDPTPAPNPAPNPGPPVPFVGLDHPTPPGALSPSVPAVPAETVVEPFPVAPAGGWGNVSPTSGAAHADAPSASTTAQPAPHASAEPSPAQVSPEKQPAVSPGTEQSIYEVGKSPYAAPIVHDARIRLPDPDDSDLPIRFRSQHPSARPIAEAGDHADQVRIAGADGRIHVGKDAPVIFGPPAD